MHIVHKMAKSPQILAVLWINCPLGALPPSMLSTGVDEIVDNKFLSYSVPRSPHSVV